LGGLVGIHSEREDEREGIQTYGKEESQQKRSDFLNIKYINSLVKIII
jgi:hypothetical protein